jgi:hypothetical protein
VKKKTMQEKAKAVNAAGEILKNYLQLLLCWKLAEIEYKPYKVADKNTSKEKLKTLWNEFSY